MASIIDITTDNLPLDVEAGQEGRLPGGEIIKAYEHPKGGVFWRRSNGHMLPGQPSLARGVGRKRNELAGRFIDDLFKDWKNHGEEVFEDCRKSHPHQYLKVVASLIPKELKVNHDVGDTFITLLKEMSRKREDSLARIVDVTPAKE